MDIEKFDISNLSFDETLFQNFGGDDIDMITEKDDIFFKNPSDEGEGSKIEFETAGDRKDLYAHGIQGPGEAARSMDTEKINIISLQDITAEELEELLPGSTFTSLTPVNVNQTGDLKSFYNYFSTELGNQQTFNVANVAVQEPIQMLAQPIVKEPFQIFAQPAVQEPIQMFHQATMQELCQILAQPAVQDPIQMLVQPAEEPIGATQDKKAHCVICDKYFKHNKYLSMHMTRKHSNFKLNCPKCNKGFETKELMESHLLLHDNENKRFMCKECPLRFVNRQCVRRHNSMVHHPELLEHRCKFCSKGFNRKDHMLKHEKTHVKIKKTLKKQKTKRVAVQ